MSDEDKERTIGAALLAHKEVSNQIAALCMKLDQIGNLYMKVGAGLKGHPQGLHPEREGIDVRFTGHDVSVNPEGFPTVPDVFVLTDKLRKALIAQQELKTKLADFLPK
jgi:hypothetical protein